MHVVTKILVVFCAILSLLLAALTMAYASNASAIRASVQNEQAARVAAQTEAASQIAQSSQLQLAIADRLKGMEDELAAEKRNVSGLQAERTSLRADLERATAEASAIRNQISQLGATTDTQAALIKNYRDEVTSLREALLGAQKKEIELVDRINDLESAREVLEQNARALKEQLEEAKLTLQAAQQGGSAANSAAAAKIARELPGPLVRARVADVFRSPAGDDMIVINEGANRGIKENALMNVVRNGDQFVASVVITAVEPSRAVGRVNLYAQKGQSIAKDDMVLSRLE